MPLLCRAGVHALFQKLTCEIVRGDSQATERCCADVLQEDFKPCDKTFLHGSRVSVRFPLETNNHDRPISNFLAVSINKTIVGALVSDCACVAISSVTMFAVNKIPLKTLEALIE